MRRLNLCMFCMLAFASCSDDSALVTEEPSETRLASQFAKPALKPQQLEGEVRFSDGTIAPFGTWVRAYYDEEYENQVPGAQDQTDSENGHYGFSGDYDDWPTGTYYIKTDTVYRLSLQYEGHRSSYHIYQVTTEDQHITLRRVLPATDSGEAW